MASQSLFMQWLSFSRQVHVWPDARRSRRLFHGALIMAFGCALPGWAGELSIVPNGQTPTAVSARDDGRLTVMPAAANQDGISLNAYGRFDVGPAGVDFDNTGARARMIVNEVTGPLPSRLEGEIAIVGPRANFVLANPNGIVADGLRFINTGAIALSTGRMELAAFHPSPDRSQTNVLLRTSAGAIEIGAGGISGAFTHLELISRTLRLGGAIINEFEHERGSIRAITGASTVEIDSAVSPVDEQTPWIRYAVGEEKVDGIAVDITPLGSLTSGRIEVLVTDKGAGVRHAGQAHATHGDFVIASNGEVRLEGGAIEAMGHLAIDSASIHALPGENGQAWMEARAGGLHLYADEVGLEGARAQGAAGVRVETDEFHLSSLRDDDHEWTGMLVSNGGDIQIETTRGVTVAGADLLARGDLHVAAKGDMEITTAAGRASRVVSAAGQLTLDIGGKLDNLGSLLQGHGKDTPSGDEATPVDEAAGNTADDAKPADDGKTTAPAVVIHTGGFTNRSVDADMLAIVFGEAGDIVIDSKADIENHTARIIANGDLRLDAVGEVRNLVVKLPGSHDEKPWTTKDTDYWLGLLPTKSKHWSVDYGALAIPGQLAYLIADGDIDIHAHSVRSIGGEIRANNGDVRIEAETRIENHALRTGEFGYSKHCVFGCRVKAHSTVAINGGGITATGAVTLTAGEEVIDEGGHIDALGNIDVTAPLTIARAMDAYLAVSQSHGLGAGFGKGFARILRNDVGGTFNSGGDLSISGDIVVDGGELEADGTLVIGGERRDPRAPVHESMPRHIPGGGWFSSFLD
jgi:filamentous hemagglutinin family protein